MGNERRRQSNRGNSVRKNSIWDLALKPFLITFSVILFVGIVGIGAIKLLKGPEKKSSEGRFMVTAEAIPEEEYQAIVEEIKSENDRYAEELADEEYMRDNRIYAMETAEPDTVSITFAGDILFDSQYAVMSTLRQNGGAISAGIAPEVIRIMKESDLMMINNEFPYGTTGTPTEGKQYTFRADPSTASYLKDLGVDLVSLANNHAYDYGESALLSTFETLEAEGIPYVGAGRNLEEAAAPHYYIANNQKIAILSATQIERIDTPDTVGATETSAGVFRCWNNKKLLEQIKEAKANSDFVIVYIHWGTESQVETDWAQEEQTPQMVEAGADLIIGDHPHILQPIGKSGGVPVVYSLGNFWFNSKTLDTCLIRAQIGEGGLQSLQFIPCLQSGCRTSLLTGEEKERVLSYMRSISPNVTIDEDGYISY